MEEIRRPDEQPGKKPLVATLEIAQPAQEYFNRLRLQHFPAERNYLNAHLTLFHALPDEANIIEDLAAISEQQYLFNVTAEALRSLGNGTAFKILSPELAILHKNLQNRWFDSLTSQDKQKRNFHVTIQNKVEPELAKKLQAELSESFEPFSFTISGIQLWRYHGGPWEYLQTFHFLTTDPKPLP